MSRPTARRFASQKDKQRVCAAVVAFFPDTGFIDRLQRILPQVDAFIVIDNTPGAAATPPLQISTDTSVAVYHLRNGSNLGIARALNQGLTHALANKCQWLLTLDQDSQCYPDMVRILLGVAQTCRPQPAIIGGNYFDAKRQCHDAPLDGPGDCLPRKTVITSGCLVDTAFAQTIGGFRDDYFIDQVDHEFCLRARGRGGRVVISRKPVMDHSVGGATGPRIPLLGRMLPDHSALRKYYIARNSIVTVRTYWKQEPAWCLVRSLRLLAGLPGMIALEKDKSIKIRAFQSGIVDGLKGRMGPCRHDWLQSS